MKKEKLRQLIGEDWADILYEEFNREYMKILLDKISLDYEKNICFPEKKDVFNVFKLTPYKDIRLVLIGQDPYPNSGQAHGLAFSTLENKTPKSLDVIFNKIKKTVYPGEDYNKNNNLQRWSKQGIFLLNTILTVRQREPLSHANMGWEIFTSKVIQEICKKEKPVIFFLWGKNALQLKELIPSHHIVYTGQHPAASLYSGIGWKFDYFKEASEKIEKIYRNKIIW